MLNAINWFEIPAVDFDRAVDFYSKVLKQPVRKEVFMGVPHGIFQSEDPGVGGAIVKNDVQPSTAGVLPYLNAGNDLAGIVSRVEAAGGRVVLPVTSIGPMGTIAVFIDSEGNRMGLHSENQG